MTEEAGRFLVRFRALRSHSSNENGWQAAMDNLAVVVLVMSSLSLGLATAAGVLALLIYIMSHATVSARLNGYGRAKPRE